MAWQCGKCDGANVPAHSRHCPRRDELHLAFVDGWGLLPQVRPIARAATKATNDGDSRRRAAHSG